MRGLRGHAIAGQRVGDGVNHRRRGTDGAQFADTFHPQAVVFTGCGLVHGVVKNWRELSSRRAVVHQAAGDQLAGFFVVQQVFAQRLADALHRAAVKLAAHDHRIDDTADIVDRGIGQHLDVPGLRIHFHLGDVAAIGPGGARDGVGRFQVDALRWLPAREREQVNFDISADHVERGVGKLQIISGDFERFGGELARQRNGFFCADLNGRTAGEERT